MTEPQTHAEALRRIGLFAGLPPAALRELAERFHWRRYRAGQQVIGHLEQSRDVYFVLEGLVRVVLYSSAGKEITFREIGAGEFFGELSAIDGLPRSATVTAIAESELAIVSDELFRDLLRVYPDVAMALLERLVAAVRGLTERVYEFSALAVRNRVHAELLRMAREHSTDGKSALIHPAPTHAQIASRISTHREAVTRELNQLTRAGLIERRHERLFVPDLEALDRLVRDAGEA